MLFVPDFAEAYEKLALAYERKGLQLESRYARGMQAYSNGRYEEAIPELEAALAAPAPVSAAAYTGLGLVRESQGQRDLAIAAYQQALAIQPDGFNARAGLARLGGVTAPHPVATEGGSVTP